jgi:RNA polymerase sigma-B factor
MVASFPTQPQAAPLHARNRALLEALGHSTHRQAALHWRNALVTANLPLVRMVAERQRQRCAEPFDDLVSMGVLGLIRAVEAFDIRHHGSLSSFAVPYIRGAMLHGLRDHGQPLHTPRRLRELQQRARRQLDLLRQAGQPAPSTAELARQLSCKTAQLEEAAAVQRALKLRSLDAPCQSSGDDSDAGPTSLLDQLPAAAPTPPAAESEWLQRQLALLTATEQRLLVGHWIEERSWPRLARELGLSAQAARRQGEALLAALQMEALQAEGQPNQASQPIANAAAAAV